MLGPVKVRQCEGPTLVCLESLVPADHFYRHLAACLDLSFVREWVAECYAAGGRPSIDPVVFFKLQLVMFFEGVRSERLLMRVVADRLSVRWYLGYDLDEPLPDHSSLTRIRERLGLPIFQRCFERVVELCQDAGLVWGKELYFDSTKVNANADFDSLTPRWYLRAKAQLDQLFHDDDAATTHEQGAQSSDALTRLPPITGQDQAGRLASENRTTWRLLDQLRLDPRRPSSRGYQRQTDLRVSTTDPDATPIQTGAKPTLGYRDHYVVDGGRARIILNAVVLPGDVMDQTTLRDLLQRARFRWHLHPKRAVADAMYGTADTTRFVEEAGVHAYMPLRDFEERTLYYPISRFTYDAERDSYTCPQGELLTRSTAKYTEGTIMYRATAATCNACPVKSACTASHDGRTLRRSVDAAYVERVRGYHATEAYQRAMRKRQVWPEPLVGEATQWHNLRRFRLRRLWRVNTEALVVAAGQNLKRWLSKMGWGRRSGPGGSLALTRHVHGAGPVLTDGHFNQGQREFFNTLGRCANKELPRYSERVQVVRAPDPARDHT
jgi:transposase